MITSSSGEEGSAKIALAKKLGKDIMGMEVDQQFDWLYKKGPMTRDKQRRMAEWLEKGRKKMEEVTYKTYCEGHDHYAQTRIEAEKKKTTEGKKDKGEASNKGSKRVRRKSVAQLIIKQKELADIIGRKKKR